ncbi:MAG: hypothetical protein L0Y66_09585 [Myxococcaceae bacterium]|nr:hypothetical protein [Myxococcaceae bacterium]MCI0671200.1 hypothetical protein [Myxococcaceae bacterium]
MSKLRTRSPEVECTAPAGGGDGASGDGRAAGLASRALRDALALLAFAHDLADEPLSPLEVQGLLILVEGRLRRDLEEVEQAEAGGLAPV